MWHIKSRVSTVSYKDKFLNIEESAQSIWAGIYDVEADQSKEKYYVLSMFPYPSGKIHAGHLRNYAISDIVARFKCARGYNVLHPIGWDAFGLPAENAAKEFGIDPRVWTEENIASMKKVFERMGLAFSWQREVKTCSREYYVHQQRMFLEMLRSGLAYRKLSYVNWDPVDQTVLANEQVVAGRGWRSGAVVEQKELWQWSFKITDFAEELLQGLDHLEEGWPEKVLLMQRNWIGKSHGVEVDFRLTDGSTLTVFTTRAETLFGASFLAISAQHPLVKAFKDEDILSFIKECESMSTAEADIETAEKKGIYTGIDAIHPITGKSIPLYIANYVLMHYGTGAIFGCPAHDERDHEFAGKYKLPIVTVIENDRMVNSGFLDDMPVQEAKEEIVRHMENAGTAKAKTNYRLKDWGVSRQRYWGCPIPVVHCSNCGIVEVPESELPVDLPSSIDFSCSGNPLESAPDWYNIKCYKCGSDAKRETDTLDTFVDSAWYFFRFTSPSSALAFDKMAAEYWCPVDLYIGGVEHAVMHLIYARFFTRVLKQLGYTNISEPFLRLINQGMVNHITYKDSEGRWLYPDDVILEDGVYKKKDDGTEVTPGRIEKMSKSKKNIISPEAIFDKYGVDTARLFVMSDTPIDKDMEWSTIGVEGAFRYISRIYDFFEENQVSSSYDYSSVSIEVKKLVNKTVYLVTTHLENTSINTAIAKLREFSNYFMKQNSISENDLSYCCLAFLRLFYPIIPHISEHIWQRIKGGGLLESHGPHESLGRQQWPTYEEELISDDIATIAVQVNGKLRGTFEAEVDISQDSAIEIALSLDSIKKHIENKEIKKTIYIPGKIVSIVCR